MVSTQMVVVEAERGQAELPAKHRLNHYEGIVNLTVSMRRMVLCLQTIALMIPANHA